MLHFIAKPQKGRKAKLLDQIKERLDREGVEYAFHLTTKKGEDRELAASLSEREDDIIVVVGGDGTLNGVLSGLKNPSRATIGVIPAGTGNDFAEAAKIPFGIGALDLILKGTPKETDYIEFSDGKRCMNIAGVGIDVDILIRCEKKKFFRGRSKYFFSLVSALFHYRGMPVTIRANGEEHTGKMLIATVCNGSQFGGGIPICPPAKIDDGKLEIVFADCPSRVKIPFALIKLMRGKILSLPFAHHIVCEEAEFLSEGALEAQYDGELARADVFCAHLGRGLKVFRG